MFGRGAPKTKIPASLSQIPWALDIRSGSSTAPRIVANVYSELSKAYSELKTSQYETDCLSLNEAMVSYYRIARKLKEFDTILGKAAAGDLDDFFIGRLQVEAGEQALRVALTKWATGVGIPLYEETVKQRNQLADAFLAASDELRKCRRHIALAVNIKDVSALLPEFAALDAATTLLSDIERVAGRAQAVSEAVSEITVPQLTPLDQPSEPSVFAPTPSPALHSL